MKLWTSLVTATSLMQYRTSQAPTSGITSDPMAGDRPLQKTAQQLGNMRSGWRRINKLAFLSTAKQQSCLNTTSHQSAKWKHWNRAPGRPGIRALITKRGWYCKTRSRGLGRQLLLISIIILTGMDITTAILLIDQILRHREAGMPRDEQSSRLVRSACVQF